MVPGDVISPDDLGFLGHGSTGAVVGPADTAAHGRAHLARGARTVRARSASCARWPNSRGTCRGRRRFWVSSEAICIGRCAASASRPRVAPRRTKKRSSARPVVRRSGCSRIWDRENPVSFSRSGEARPGRLGESGRSVPIAGRAPLARQLPAATASKTAWTGVRVKSVRFIDTWTTPRWARVSAQRLDAGQAAAALAHRRRNAALGRHESFESRLML